MEVERTLRQDEGQLAMAQQQSLEAPAAVSVEAPTVPGYVLEKLLGRGTFGEVWAGVHSRTGQKVAVKLFTNPGGLDWVYLKHEVARLRQVAEHPHVVTLLDADLAHEPPYFVMTHYERSLSGEKVGVGQAADWMQQMASALRFTHSRGLLHCDLKPANVLLDSEGRLRLADFGQSLTRGVPGSALGSLGYMAPEQAGQESTTPEVSWDIYSLGATVYSLLTGRPPRLSAEDRETLDSIAETGERLRKYREVVARTPLVPVRALRPEVDADLADLVEACLRLEPARRPDSAAAILEDLDRRGRRQPLLCRRPWNAGYLFPRFLQRNAVPLVATFLVLFALAALAANLVASSRQAQRDLARQEFERGWALAQQGHSAEGALWWLESLARDPGQLAARHALESPTTTPPSGSGSSRRAVWSVSFPPASPRSGSPSPATGVCSRPTTMEACGSGTWPPAPRSSARPCATPGRPTAPSFPPTAA